MPDWITGASETIAREVGEVVEDRRAGVVREEADFTSRMLGGISTGLRRTHIDGVRWTGVVVKKQTEEPRIGADFLASLAIEVEGYRVEKGFLAQAKFLGRRKQVDKKRLQHQCEAMLGLTSAAYVFLYYPETVYVAPAIAVVANGGEPRDLPHWTAHELFYEHLSCFAGDRRLGRSASDVVASRVEELDAWRREFGARQILALAALPNPNDTAR